MLIFEFTRNCNISDWKITNDVVMGGKSNGQFFLDDGNGVFKGEVSLENNGGFSSVKHKFESKIIADYNSIILKVKGDGKRYQFRVKSAINQRHSFVYKFDTSGEWQTIEILLSELYPIYRGRKLEASNFSDKLLEEVAFLIANKKNEFFELKIARIGLK